MRFHTTSRSRPACLVYCAEIRPLPTLCYRRLVPFVILWPLSTRCFPVNPLPLPAITMLPCPVSAILFDGCVRRRTEGGGKCAVTCVHGGQGKKALTHHSCPPLRLLAFTWVRWRCFIAYVKTLIRAEKLWSSASPY
ncbi:hypothetical protein O3P69_004630 [Scylla paramamosain]|uniref:Uncharacterized protein n=1 Tax=Scylla paramamosain TaxID=85552 RepID=A0AAW0UAM3_SCYPA